MDDLLLNSDEEYEQLLATMRAEQAVYVLPALEPSRMLELHQQMQTLRVCCVCVERTASENVLCGVWCISQGRMVCYA